MEKNIPGNPQMHKKAQEAAGNLFGFTKWFLRIGIRRFIYLGHEQKSKWGDKLPFYLFLCEECACYAKDYPHGFREFLEMEYIICSNCGTSNEFITWPNTLIEMPSVILLFLAFALIVLVSFVASPLINKRQNGF